MELFFRYVYHSFMMFVFRRTGLQNFDAYEYNIKRIDLILRNDYRNFTCEELSTESEGSCSVVSGDVPVDEGAPRTEDFELPPGTESDGSEQDSGEESDEDQHPEEPEP